MVKRAVVRAAVRNRRIEISRKFSERCPRRAQSGAPYRGRRSRASARAAFWSPSIACAGERDDRERFGIAGGPRGDWSLIRMDYLFVWHRSTRRFPLRFVIGPDREEAEEPLQ
jgi:hypothetical protein